MTIQALGACSRRRSEVATIGINKGDWLPLLPLLIELLRVTVGVPSNLVVLSCAELRMRLLVPMLELDIGSLQLRLGLEGACMLSLGLLLIDSLVPGIVRGSYRFPHD